MNFAILISHTTMIIIYIVMVSLHFARENAQLVRQCVYTFYAVTDPCLNISSLLTAMAVTQNMIL
jgi:hypothetical protein